MAECARSACGSTTMMTTRRPLVRFAWLWPLLVAAPMTVLPTTAAAQETVRDIIGFLMTNQAVPTSDTESDRAAAEAVGDTITRSLLINLTSIPIATSSSGFLYRLNPELGTVERATESFGGFFVERALTTGAGHASFGVSASTSSFDRLDGTNLRDGSLLVIANRFPDEAEPFDREFLTMRLGTSTMTVFGTVGLTDQLDVGAVVPFVRLTLQGARMNVYRTERITQADATATASGVADIALRAKYTLFAARQGGVAVAGEYRLPTGDADNLLGAGSPSGRVLGIAAVESGAVTLSGNFGVVRGGVSDEFTYSGAVAVAVQPRLTLAGEFLVRQIDELRPVLLSSAPHPTIRDGETVRLVGGDAGRTLTMGIAGIKWNAAGRLVVTGHVRWSFTSAGLTARLTPSVGLEYGF
jgi:hypothetical protein